jgi:hypothetical protein
MVERFRYQGVSDAGFALQWFVTGKDGVERLGDSIACVRA